MGNFLGSVVIGICLTLLVSSRSSAKVVGADYPGSAFEEAHVLALAQIQLEKQGAFGTDSMQLAAVDAFDQQTKFRNCTACADYVIEVEGVGYKFLTELKIRQGVVAAPIATSIHPK